MRPATTDEVRSFENLVDQWFYAHLPPQREMPPQATWEFLTVSEDLLRQILLSCVQDSDPPIATFCHYVNRVGEGIRRTFGAVELPQSGDCVAPVVRSIPQEPYEWNAKLHLAALCYASLYEQFLLFHRGYSVAEISKDGMQLSFRSTAFHPEFHAMDTMERMTRGTPTSADILCDYLRYLFEIESPDLGEPIGQDAIPIIAEMLSEEPNDQMALRFAAEDTEQSILPENFRVLNMAGADIAVTLKTIRRLAICHLLSVFHLSDHYKIVGGLVETCIPVWKRSSFAERVVRLSGVESAVVNRIISMLTYGIGMKNPDPFLQPLFPGPFDTVSVIPVMMAFSEVERNFLALTSKAAPRDFDGASAVFAVEMTNRVESSAIRKGWLVRKEFSVASMRYDGPIDIIMADPRAQVLLVLELRWTIRPGGVHEVLDRIELVKQKVAQVQRKARAVREHQDDVLRALGIPAAKYPWEVASAVIVNGFLGRGSESPETPAMPEATFVRLFEGSKSVADLAASILGTGWRLVKDVHYSLGVERVKIGDRELLYEVCGPTREAFAMRRPRFFP